MDFYRINRRTTKNGIEIAPEFMPVKSKDLMLRGGKFYAVWNEQKNQWSLDEYDVYLIIDNDLRRYVENFEKTSGNKASLVRYMAHFDTGSVSKWRSYLNTLSDNYTVLDNNLIFANTQVTKEDYSSKDLSYALEPGDCSAWDELIGTLYSPQERAKIEWAIGSVVSGESKQLQKFLVLYGSAGTGKSTVLQIIEKLFDGYVKPFEGKALTSSTNAFATEAFRDNPLVVLQHDGDLSRIEDNTKLNSIISHETMIINEKYRSSYSLRPQAFIFMGTNNPVKISDARSGLLRRLIDVQPTGKLVPFDYYQVLMGRIEFELGAIAYHCLQVFKKAGVKAYDKYRPTDMMYSTNVFFNFVEAYFDELSDPDGITLKRAYGLYREFCNESENKIMQMQTFREEMRSYYEKFHHERIAFKGSFTTGVFRGFRKDRFAREPLMTQSFDLVLDKQVSLLDDILKEMPAQYAASNGNPSKKWVSVQTTLADLDTSKLHFVKVPEQHIVIDFDLVDEQGNKSIDKNLEAAGTWPPTYAEFSKSGHGIHLHYIYTGDVSELSNSYSEGIEVKTLLGDSSLRRMFTRCNDIPVATLSSGLPIKETNKMLDAKTIKSEKGLRDLISRNLRKEIHPGTKPSIDFIKKILDDAYDSGLPYDVTDLRSRIVAFANNSTNRPLECLKIVQHMRFKSDVPLEPIPSETSDTLVFFDVEVYSNLFVVCWKYAESDQVVRMINPSPEEVEGLFKLKLVGFNNRRYDNHILYARFLGYSNEELFLLSQKIINNDNKNARPLFGEAYGLSYTDIYDFSSKKQGLKKFQFELGLPHKEMDHPWDEPVPTDKWNDVIEYCVNDVITTEQVFNSRRQDFVARQILAEISGLSVNDTTQRHTAKIIFGDDRNPQSSFVYTDLSTVFPGYIFEAGKSSYRGENPSEGGYVYAEPGIYENVAVLDVASMHPSSIVALDLFGPYTKRFQALLDGRLAIKHHEYEKAGRILGDRVTKLIGSDPDAADALSYALKIVINIVYGLTSAKFDNPFRDIRNIDNIVAKRGALFMIDLKHAVQEMGFQVVHIKTDSIKIPNATPEIIQFIHDFGAKYGYVFEHEKTYAKFCLVNDAVYIAKEVIPMEVGSHNRDAWKVKWDAVGAQFQHPYVYKKLFTHEPVLFDDMCEMKSVLKGAIYIDFEREGPAGSIADMHFIGRTGSFVPVVKTAGGGKLYRVQEGKKYALVGTKGYLWMESDVVRELGPSLEASIDRDYFDGLISDAIAAIEKFGSYSQFVKEHNYGS